MASQDRVHRINQYQLHPQIAQRDIVHANTSAKPPI